MEELFKAAAANPQITGWAIAFVVFLIVEGLTLNALVSIWFAAGALLAMLAAIAGLNFVWQLAIFAVSSAVLLVLSRPLVKRLQRKTPQDPTENHDIGKKATVVEPINNDSGEGRVKLDGVYWAARSADGGDIAEGAIVTVCKVDGSKLIVAR